jgi:hypothetical protein
MRPPIPNALVEPALLLVEGAADQSFFAALMNERSIRGIDVAYPAAPHPGGKTGYWSVLRALRLVRGFESLRNIILVADSDGDSEAAFAFMIAQLQEADGYALPDVPHSTTTGGDPLVTVLLVPWMNESGDLETLCLPACYDKWPTVGRCVDAMAECTGVGAWEPTKKSKALLRWFISSTCRPDPNTSLVHLWSRPPEYRIPLQHVSFDKIANFLDQFSAS